MRRRRGFVLTVAVMLIALAAVAIAVLTARVGTTARQVRQAREQAQVEQLLLAGMEVAKQGQREREIALPSALSENGAKLKLVVRGEQVAVEASMGSTTMR
jgi:type II secretory pathway component PulK